MTKNQAPIAPIRRTHRPAQGRLLAWLRDHQDIHFTTADPAADLDIARTTISSALQRWNDAGAIEGLSNPSYGIWMYRPHANGRPAEPTEAEYIAERKTQNLAEQAHRTEVEAALAGGQPARPARRSRQLRRDDLLRVIGNAGARVLVADEHDRIYVLQELEA